MLSKNVRWSGPLVVNQMAEGVNSANFPGCKQILRERIISIPRRELDPKLQKAQFQGGLFHYIAKTQIQITPTGDMGRLIGSWTYPEPATLSLPSTHSVVLDTATWQPIPSSATHPNGIATLVLNPTWMCGGVTCCGTTQEHVIILHHPRTAGLKGWWCTRNLNKAAFVTYTSNYSQIIHKSKEQLLYIQKGDQTES